ncbi:DUF4251 domain-containing protein [Flammeovirga kamogawensis]|uniref:DUF4251 domain-containing protein n=1 Tax=Flammeovirga kamogawensis TaxID=373891 RepID=A0ABX8H0J4_9BACT|nr:DUF4251 domain-containing protein [Flammeovirga kamogawensis]MBB6459121.1 hypothetical protein [Flammeovirga kamogawensis]QWG08690.1 DUF4251 domain-containing protein [Flammeovirga kamogawensis]TRX66983.1 DUF4251 domain-containing protein [Flammeovirga kamogawensis]
MNTSIIRKITFAITLLFGFTLTTAIAQETTLTKKEQKALKKEEKRKAKEQKKAEQEAYEKIIHEQAVTAIDSQQFVLEANQLYDRRGRTVNVQSNINFIKVSGDVGVVQIGSASLVGYNGVGGITVDGKISDWKVRFDEKSKRTYVSFNIMGPTLTAKVTYDLDGVGNYANCRIDGVFSSSQLKMRGILKPNSQSKTYQGMIRY